MTSPLVCRVARRRDHDHASSLRNAATAPAANSRWKPPSPSSTNTTCRRRAVLPPEGPLVLLRLDDLACVTKDQAETSVLFELISARYERRSTLITANQPFGEWNRIFPDPAMTLAAVDRLVHHATILELNVESYRRRAAVERRKGPGRPPTRATIKDIAD